MGTLFVTKPFLYRLMLIGSLTLLAPLPGYCIKSELQEVMQRLSLHQKVLGDFKQDRKIANPKVTLHSEGHFVFEFPMQLQWNQLKPFQQTIQMSADKVVQKFEDAAEQVITRESQPFIFAFSASFLGAFSGDEAALLKIFDPKVSFKGTRWRLELTPHDALMKKAIARVEIEGDEFINSIEINETSGSSTSIRFLNVKDAKTKDDKTREIK